MSDRVMRVDPEEWFPNHRSGTHALIPWPEYERLRAYLEAVEHEVAIVYDNLTCGKFSKCNTLAQFVIDAVDERQDKDERRLRAEISEKDSLITELRSEVERLKEYREEDAQLIANMAYEIVDLRAELAEANRRIEELDTALNSVGALCLDGVVSWSLVTKESMGAVVEACRRVRCGGPYQPIGHIITDAEIDEAWEYVGDDTPEAARNALECFRIVACPRCGGSGVYTAWDFHPNEAPHRGQTCSACEYCHAHGWIREERGDE